MTDKYIKGSIDALNKRVMELSIEINKKLDQLDPKNIADNLEKIECTLREYGRCSDKFDLMIKELRGFVTRFCALLKFDKCKNPEWYDIKRVAPPESGEIWVKDFIGTETLATCRGKAIVLPPDSSVGVPEFWKPV